MFFLSSADIFKNIFPKKILSIIPSECLVQAQLIWGQTVCKTYQQTTLVDKELTIKPSKCSVILHEHNLMVNLNGDLLVLKPYRFFPKTNPNILDSEDYE